MFGSMRCSAPFAVETDSFEGLKVCNHLDFTVYKIEK